MEYWSEFMAGGIGGMAGVFSGHPLDTLRVRLQQPAFSSSTNRGGFSAVRLLRKVVASDGFLSLYRGMGAPLGMVAFQNALVFQTNAVLQRVLEPNRNGPPPTYKTVALAGLGSGALQSVFVSPFELVKIRLQLQIINNRQSSTTNKIGPMKITKDIIRKEGLQGIFKGLWITIIRDAPSYAIYFATYEYAREKLHPGCRKTGQESPTTMLIAGGLAGVSSWLCCYPFDVVKCRIQSLQKPCPPKYEGIVDCACKSVREEGFGVLFRGLGTTVIRAFIVNGVTFSAYELVLRFLVNSNNG